MATRPDTHPLSQLSNEVITGSKRRRLTVAEEVKVEKTKWCITVLRDYRLKLQGLSQENGRK
jgi:hypothetical protein